MPYSVSLTTRNALNPDPQLGNFWATELVKRERRGIVSDLFTVRARKKNWILGFGMKSGGNHND